MVSSILLVGLPLAVVSLWGGLGGVRGASGRLTRVVGLPRCGVLRGRRVGGVYRPSLPSALQGQGSAGPSTSGPLQA